MVKTFKPFMNVADLEKLLALTLHIIAQASHEALTLTHVSGGGQFIRRILLPRAATPLERRIETVFSEANRIWGTNMDDMVGTLSDSELEDLKRHFTDRIKRKIRLFSLRHFNDVAVPPLAMAINAFVENHIDILRRASVAAVRPFMTFSSLQRSVGSITGLMTTTGLLVFIFLSLFAAYHGIRGITDAVNLLYQFRTQLPNEDYRIILQALESEQANRLAQEREKQENSVASPSAPSGERQGQEGSVASPSTVLQGSIRTSPASLSAPSGERQGQEDSVASERQVRRGRGRNSQTRARVQRAATNSRKNRSNRVTQNRGLGGRQQKTKKTKPRADMILNPKTGRYVKKTGKIGQQLLKQSTTNNANIKEITDTVKEIDALIPEEKLKEIYNGKSRLTQFGSDILHLLGYKDTREDRTRATIADIAGLILLAYHTAMPTGLHPLDFETSGRRISNILINLTRLTLAASGGRLGRYLSLASLVSNAFINNYSPDRPPIPLPPPPPSQATGLRAAWEGLHTWYVNRLDAKFGPMTY